jgi:hypothetical protein
MASSKVPVSNQAMTRHLFDRIRFLKKSCRDYDAGDEAEFSNIALSLRILFHKTRMSTPLIEQAGVNDFNVPSYSISIDPTELMDIHPLSLLRIENGTMRHVPRLANTSMVPQNLPYREWWEQEVLRGPSRVVFTRKSLVLYVADQDGGAHVDATLDKPYHDLKNTGSTGIVFHGPHGPKSVMEVEKAYMRHIAFEFLSVVEPGEPQGSAP